MFATGRWLKKGKTDVFNEFLDPYVVGESVERTLTNNLVNDLIPGEGDEVPDWGYAG